MYSVERGAVVVSTLSSGEIIGSDYLHAAHEYYRNNLQGKMLYRKELGPIRVTGKGWEKTRRRLTTISDHSPCNRSSISEG